MRHCVGFAEALLASGAQAGDRLAEALALDPGGGELMQARVQLAYGSWLRRHRRAGEARVVLMEAHETLTRLGIAGFAYRAVRELRAAVGWIRDAAVRPD